MDRLTVYPHLYTVVVKTSNERGRLVMDTGSVTHWIKQIKAGEESAAANLWDRYHERLLNVAKRKLHADPGPADEEDVVIDALASFFHRTKNGRFPELRDREGLWKLLVTITNRKAMNQATKANRQKRGRDATVGSINEFVTPTADSRTEPDYVVMVAESLAIMLESLGDDELREIALAKLDGFSNQDISQHINRSVATVERRLRLIRTKLQEEIDNDGSAVEAD